MPIVAQSDKVNERMDIRQARPNKEIKKDRIINLSKREKKRQDANNILALVRKGMSITDVSIRLNLSYQYCFLLFKKLQERTHREQSQSIEHLIAFVASKYDLACTELYEAWENSKIDENGKKCNPNTAYMELMMRALGEVRKLMGLDKFKENQQIAIQNNNTTVQAMNWDSLLRTSKVIQAENVIQQELDKAHDPVEQRLNMMKELASKKQESDTATAHESIEQTLECPAPTKVVIVKG